MADQVVEQAVLLTVVRDVLRASGRRCEIEQPPAPPPGEVNPKMPYTIVYGVDGGDFYGGLGSPEASATAIVQLTHVARNGRDAAMQGDECRRILLGRTAGWYTNSLDTDDQKVGGRRSLGMGSGDFEGPVTSRTERYEFLVSR